MESQTPKYLNNNSSLKNFWCFSIAYQYNFRDFPRIQIADPQGQIRGGAKQIGFGEGVTPQRGGGEFSTVGPKKLGYFSTLSAPKAPRQNFEHFFRNFWEIC